MNSFGGNALKFRRSPAQPRAEAVKELLRRLAGYASAIPAQAGIQGFQSFALGPRFLRG
jgi:hypothetical protein